MSTFEFVQGFAIAHSIPNFSTNPAIDGKVFRNHVQISVTTGVIARVIPLYTNSRVGIVTTTLPNLPSQGKIIESTGRAGCPNATSGCVERKIRVVKSPPRIPLEFFQYVLFVPKST